MGHLLGYARFSTFDQNPDLQRDALKAAGCFRVFTDKASGTLDNRNELTKVLDQLRPGDTLVVWRLDRLGRSLRHLIETVTALANRKIGFRLLTENIGTTTPGGKLVFHHFGSLAEFERDLIRDRTMAGLTAARTRGRVGGRPPALTPDKLAVAQQMHASRQHTIEAIAEVVGVSRAALYRHLDYNQTSQRQQPHYRRSQPRRREHSQCYLAAWDTDGSTRPTALDVLRSNR